MVYFKIILLINVFYFVSCQFQLNTLKHEQFKKKKFESLLNKYNTKNTDKRHLNDIFLQKILKKKRLTADLFDRIVETTVDCEFRNYTIVQAAKECLLERLLVKEAASNGTEWAVESELKLLKN